jgi:hypothetical protein
MTRGDHRERKSSSRERERTTDKMADQFPDKKDAPGYVVDSEIERDDGSLEGFNALIAEGENILRRGAIEGDKLTSFYRSSA